MQRVFDDEDSVRNPSTKVPTRIFICHPTALDNLGSRDYEQTHETSMGILRSTREMALVLFFVFAEFGIYMMAFLQYI